jgi:catechol 2,3-dioxygenase-like lactoylglutathione lyase family enzyme
MGMQLTKPGIDLGIVTTRGEAMLTFYRDVLGLKYLRELPLPGFGGVMHQLAANDTVVKIVVMPTSPSAPAPGGLVGGTGLRYFTFSVSNLTEVVQSCVAHGAKVAMPEQQFRPGVRIAMVEDPDGNWVEFLSVG